MVIEWTHRDRTIQTGETPIGWTAGSVTLEEGVTYTIGLYTDATLTTLIREYTEITDDTWTYPNEDVIADGSLETLTVVVKSVRDDLECLYPWVHTVNRTTIS
jgi:hypothetical protein